MKITASFNKQFEWETLQSEKLRAAILASYSLFTCGYILLSAFIIGKDDVEGFTLPYTLIYFLAGLSIYEFITNRVLDRRIRIYGKSIHPYFKYVNAFVELTIITVMLYVYSIYFEQSLLSDVVLVSLYYLIVFLSAFYLDAVISVFTGLFAGISYTALHILQTREKLSSSELEEFLYNKYFIYATGVLLIICGIAAAFMARQLKNGIQRTVELIEDENKLFNLFSRQISRDVAIELLDKEGKMPSELRFVSVMFIDIRDFTVYAETQEPEAIVRFQNIYFGMVTEIVNKHKGIVNQFLGDGCMITFGAPVALDNPSHNAVLAALEIKKAVEEAIQSKKVHEFKIGVGIHCGNAVIGNIGTTLKSEYSITGGVVILAARIEQVNKELNSQILISKEVYEKTYELVSDARTMGDFHLKGWSHPVELYKLS